MAYAISLSMGVSYRQLRSSRLITHFDRAKASLEASCALLEDLSGDWYSAEAMARLGRKALLQIDHEHGRRGTPEPAKAQAADSSDTVVSGSGLESVNNAPMISGIGGAESSQRVVDVDSTLPPVQPTGVESEAGMGSPLMAVNNMNDLDSTMMHGFADIDTLFGEFLDISLPTNFWDPLFAEDDSMGGQ